MKLREYLDAHIGDIVRVGCKEGTGFIYAGIILPETEIIIAKKTRRRFVSNLPILEKFESFYGGDVIMIPGKASGHEWMPKELERKPLPDCPIEHYQSLADWIAGATAKLYIDSYMIANTSPKRIARENAETEMMLCERFFNSDSFALMMPHVDADDLMRLLKKKAREKCPDVDDYER